MQLDQIEKIAVLGAGVMGHGIAQVASTAGYKIVIRDIKQEYLNISEKNIKKNLNRLVERGRIKQEEIDEILSRITFTLDLSKAVIDAQLVIEAIPEIMSLKQALFQNLGKFAPEHAILTTNTSTMSITRTLSHAIFST